MKENLNYEETSKTISKINKIVETCPTEVKEKCFELLFELEFAKSAGKVKKSISSKEDEHEKEEENNKPKTEYKLPGNVLVILRKNQLTENDLEKLFMLEHEPILPIYKIDVSKMSQAQIQKVFMILLENALSTGNFKADYSEIRDSCKEEGLYDSNFSQNLKNKHKLFRGAITNKTIDESGVVELSGEGMIKLAGIIKQLIQ